jgi:hypothetical protein
VCSLFFWRSRNILWRNYVSGRTNSQVFGGAVMRPADVAIAWPTLGRLHNSETADVKVLLQFAVLLLYDNARPGIARTTVNLLNTWHWEILPYPPCSTDLAPSDCPLLTKLKKHLQGLRFQTDEDVKQEVKWWLRLQDATFYHQGLDCLIYRCDKFVNRYGDCVEKQTAYVPTSNTCVTLRNLFVLRIKDWKPYFMNCPCTVKND